MRGKFKKQRRYCLKCNRRFLSEGNWNRLCNKCNAKNQGQRQTPSSTPKMNGELLRQRGAIL